MASTPEPRRCLRDFWFPVAQSHRHRTTNSSLMAPYKRKNRPAARTSTSARVPGSYSVPDPSLFIQAHEADIIRGPRALSAAVSLEVNGTSVGNALLKWGAHENAKFGQQLGTSGLGFDDSVRPMSDSVVPDVWIDRYDARLLLDALPIITQSQSQPSGIQKTRAPSPSGWSDLPSDAEDTFFFSPEENEDYHREKRRRLIDQSREARLRALAAEEGDDEPAELDPWGGSDEEPDEAQLQLMRRTATHLSTSPNPAQLEMRILANHGADRRFAFLRGRWSRAWKLAKAKAAFFESSSSSKTRGSPPASAAVSATLAMKGASSGSGLVGLTSYGDSDSDADESDASDARSKGVKDQDNEAGEDRSLSLSRSKSSFGDHGARQTQEAGTSDSGAADADVDVDVAMATTPVPPSSQSPLPTLAVVDRADPTTSPEVAPVTSDNSQRLGAGAVAGLDEEAAKEARRARAREWAAKRRLGSKGEAESGS
ncbi:hypothetical protein CONPUDRAFT_170245 [Coniophora puteana RWD-64-598 SS2]|uniref:SURP motif domain-containing protein n=1 Tax=Coniophora puteana (strain RWD-64-598) TaxID=741705 RepID=R7SEG5_CONPW|nr:uncharacterized protein CONPUDRAFT_170245 [Coniophora puteana RWD-64-598 SS2]EIW74225.1 hypothetical protein CONPUDRAFT_170245 [Coniophora puteana RWD-64-598 SS2]